MFKKIEIGKNNSMENVLLFFCLFIVILILIVILFSHVKVNVKSFQFLKGETDLLKFNISVGIYLFNKFKILWVNFDKAKIKKMNFRNKIKVQKFDQEIIKLTKNLGLKIEKINLDLRFDTNSIFITTYLVVIISTVLSIIFSKIAKKQHDCKYNIIPIYRNTNSIDINLNGIISVKLVHIISMLYILVKKGRNDKNERMSNRRAYGYKIGRASCRERV